MPDGRWRRLLRSGVMFPDDETKVQGVFEKNLDFARNVATTDTDRTARNVRFRRTRPPLPGQGLAGHRGERVRRLLRQRPAVEANVRRVLGAVDAEMTVATAGRHPLRLTLRMSENAAVSASATPRQVLPPMRVTPPADFVQPGTIGTARPLVAGDVVTVIIRAGGQQQQFRYRVQSTHRSGAKRVLVIAAEDYKGVSPNKTPYARRRATRTSTPRR